MTNTDPILTAPDVFDSRKPYYPAKNDNRKTLPLAKKVLIEIASRLGKYVHFDNRKPYHFSPQGGGFASDLHDFENTGEG